MKKIIALVDPTISIAEIDIKDIEFGTNPEYAPDGSETKLSRLAGSLAPMVQINGMKFMYDAIENLQLNISGFLPKITVTVKDKVGMFASKSFPKDGDVISLYIKSDSKDFKPIRQDYRIMDTSSQPSKDAQGEINSHTLSGLLDVPELFVDKIKSFNNMSSFDTLKTIAKELGLGFASNETGSQDSMTRICPSTSYDDFILNDVLPSSYKDDDSFWTAYVDQYYYLNFVQVNELLVHDVDIDQARINRLVSSDYENDDTDVIVEMKDMYLSNSRLSAGTPNYISGYTPINNSGNISMKNGYRTFVQYYDKNKADFSQYYIETLNSKDSSDKIILKGRENEDHTKQIRAVRFTEQFGDNVHENYHHAKLQNKYNNDELNKLNLLVNLGGINPMIRRNQIVPVVIIDSGGSDVKRLSSNDGRVSGKGEDNMTINKLYTGFYTIGSINLIYNSSSSKFFYQALLQRREYDIPI